MDEAPDRIDYGSPFLNWLMYEWGPKHDAEEAEKKRRVDEMLARVPEYIPRQVTQNTYTYMGYTFFRGIPMSLDDIQASMERVARAALHRDKGQ